MREQATCRFRNECPQQTELQGQMPGGRNLPGILQKKLSKGGREEFRGSRGGQFLQGIVRALDFIVSEGGAVKRVLSRAETWSDRRKF